MPFVDVEGGRIYYERHGPKPGGAPAIVFAHGAGGNHLSWWQQVPHFESGYTCIVFDHRGFGQSIDADGRMGAAFADDLRALLDHLAIERAHLVAQSMGGWTCLRFAVRHPERVVKLVMSDTPGGLSTPEVTAAARSASQNAGPPPEGVHPAAGARMRDEQPDLAFLYAEIDALNPPRERAQLGELIRSCGNVSAEEAAGVKLPVLFIAGEEDIVIQPPIIDAAAGCFPNASVERVAKAGHSVYFERADIYNALVDKFLAS
ncbi:MAG: alpha/beta hydrolase [Dehalococcoidia bacterium]